MKRRLRIAMLGSAFMGRAHARAWREAGRIFDLPAELDCELLVGRDPARTAAAADRLGFRRWTVDWASAVADPEVDVVDICLPGDLHASVALAALAAGKHVLCEKPLANSLVEAAAMADAADKASARGTFAMVGFNYRRVPALAVARQLVASGSLGALRQVRLQYLQDWLVDASAPMTWRLMADRAGTGALGDLGSHLVDLARWLIGDEVEEVSSTSATFVERRPVSRSSGMGNGAGGVDLARVTVDDAVLALLRFGGGAIGTLEASRIAMGHKNHMLVELHGDRGGVRFDLERLNELEVIKSGDGTPRASRSSGFRRLLVTEPEDPYLGGWWPPGHVLGWEHSFVHEVVDFVAGLTEGRQPEPSFRDGMRTQAVLDAIASAATSHGWVRPSMLLADVAPSPETFLQALDGAGAAAPGEQR